MYYLKILKIILLKNNLEISIIFIIFDYIILYCFIDIFFYIN